MIAMVMNGDKDNGARMLDGILCEYISVDPLSDKYPSMSHYVHCADNPLSYIDPDGRAWRPILDGDRHPVGYEWIEPEDSYDSNGKLLNGLYEQAIFFSENGTFDPDIKYNMGSSTATVYLADGTTETFNACTHPSDKVKYPTIPDGNYEAKIGKHRGNYDVLRVGDVGTVDFYSNRIDLGMPNPAHPSRNYALGINIHKPGFGNLTGETRKGNPVSAGCILVDISQWKRFIELFNMASQYNNVVSISVSRYYSKPINF